MSKKFFVKGLQGLGDGTIDIDTNTQKAMILDLTVASTLNKAISAATNATPVSVTATSHGFTSGDIVVIRGATGNTVINGMFKITVIDANTFTLQTLNDGLNVVGNGAYAGSAYAFNLSKVSASTDCSAGRVAGSTDVTLTTPVNTNGIIDATTIPTFNINASTNIHAIIFYQSSGTDRLWLFEDGKIQVVLAASASGGATTLAVEKLASAIASGTVLVFTNGVSVTLSAPAAAGDRTLTVTAIGSAIAVGHEADAVTVSTPAALPISNGASAATFTYTQSSSASKLGKY